MRSTDKLEVFSCVHTLVELSERYAPSRHPAAWRPLALECAGDAGAGEQSWSAAALVAQVLRLARSLRFGLDLRFQAHAVLFASRLLHAIALHQAGLRALALDDTFRVALFTQTQTHVAAVSINGIARSLYPTSPSKSSKAAGGSKIAKDELPVKRGGDGESGVCYGSSIAFLLAAAGRVEERVCG